MSEVAMGNSNVAITDEVLGMHGLKLCEGCKEMIVRHRFCAECLRISDIYESKRLEEKHFLEAAERADMGVVSYAREPYGVLDAFADLSWKVRLALGAGLFGGGCVVAFCIWLAFKGLVWLALEVSR